MTMPHYTRIEHWRNWRSAGEHQWYVACACGWESAKVDSPALAEDLEAQHLKAALDADNDVWPADEDITP